MTFTFSSNWRRKTKGFYRSKATGQNIGLKCTSQTFPKGRVNIQPLSCLPIRKGWIFPYEMSRNADLFLSKEYAKFIR